MTTHLSHKQLIVVVALLEREGKFLIVRRYDPEYPQWHHRWGLPGGKINPGETPLQAIQREVLEETQLTFNQPRLLGIHTHNWQTTQGVQQTFIALYHCVAGAEDVKLCLEENDLYAWEELERIIAMQNLLDGNAQMIKELYQNRELCSNQSEANLLDY